MHRCPHENVTITETVHEHTNHLFEDGVYKFSGHYIGEEFATLWITCKDCGLNHRYSKSHLPKRLQKKWDLILNRDARMIGHGTARLEFVDQINNDTK